MERKNEDTDGSFPFMIWLDHFRTDKYVNPSFYKSFLEGTTKIVPYDYEVLTLFEMNWEQEPWEVIFYEVGNDLTPSEIKEIVDTRNNIQNKCAYMWSCPPTLPSPVIIQRSNNASTKS